MKHKRHLNLHYFIANKENDNISTGYRMSHGPYQRADRSSETGIWSRDCRHAARRLPLLAAGANDTVYIKVRRHKGQARRAWRRG